MSIIDLFNDWADERIYDYASSPYNDSVYNHGKIEALKWAKVNIKRLAVCKEDKNIVCLDTDACASCRINVKYIMEGK